METLVGDQQAQIGILQDTKDDLQEKVSAGENDIQRYSSQMELMQMEIEKKESRLLEATSSLSEMEAIVLTNEQESSGLKAKLHSLTAQLAGSQETIQGLTANADQV